MLGETGPVTFLPENTGGELLSVRRHTIRVEHPHTPTSLVQPERAEMEALVWNNPEHRRETPVQYVLMGGFNSSAVESHTIFSALTRHADTVVGIAHPDAPTSRITPADSPFNDEGSLANSGFTILRAIEQLTNQGILSKDHPVTVVGFSTGGTVLLEATAQDIAEAKRLHRPRRIGGVAMLGSPGMMETDKHAVTSGVIATGKEYWEEFLTEQGTQLLGILKNPMRLARALAEAATTPSDNPLEEVAHAISIAKRWKINLQSLKKWPDEEAWKRIEPAHRVFDALEQFARMPRFRLWDEALAKFHRMWIDQLGYPHLAPETPAWLRNRENVVHDITKTARAEIQNTPLIIWFGEHDTAIPPEGLLSPQDRKKIADVPNKNDKMALQEERMVQRIRALFPNNGKDLHILLGKGKRSHHLTPREDASIMELYFLRYFHPELVPEMQTWIGTGAPSHPQEAPRP